MLFFISRHAETAAQAKRADDMMNADRTMLTDAMQDRIKDILPGKAADPGGAAADNGLFLKAAARYPDGIAPVRPSGAFRQTDSVFKRFRRQALSGDLERVFNALSDDFDFEYVFIDGTIVQAHQKATGAKGGPAGKGSAVPGAGWLARFQRSRTRSVVLSGS